MKILFIFITHLINNSLINTQLLLFFPTYKINKNVPLPHWTPQYPSKLNIKQLLQKIEKKNTKNTKKKQYNLDSKSRRNKLCLSKVQIKQITWKSEPSIFLYNRRRLAKFIIYDVRLLFHWLCQKRGYEVSTVVWASSCPPFTPFK